MKITVLLENTRMDPALKALHGLSLYIETENEKVLFDTGPSEAIIENAKVLGLDLKSLSKVVISHGHKDHTGGLPSLLPINNCPVYLKTGADGFFYSKQLTGRYKDISMEKNIVDEQFHFLTEAPLNENMWILNNHHKDGFIPSSDSLFEGVNGQYVSDHFEHELIYVIKESDGLVVFTGCSHQGVGNMLRTVSDQFKEPIKAVFGGMHLYKHSLNQTEDIKYIHQLCDELDDYPDTLFYTGHCTGEEAYKILEERLKERIYPLKTGLIYTV